jgi:hypothetical protein
MDKSHTLLAICVVALAGCGTAPVKLDASQVVSLECGAEPKVDRLHMRKVEPWVVEDVAGITWIGISPDHYENLSTNIADVKKQLTQRVAVNKFYRKCIESFNAPQTDSP